MSSTRGFGLLTLGILTALTLLPVPSHAIPFLKKSGVRRPIIEPVRQLSGAVYHVAPGQGVRAESQVLEEGNEQGLQLRHQLVSFQRFRVNETLPWYRKPLFGKHDVLPMAPAVTFGMTTEMRPNPGEPDIIHRIDQGDKVFFDAAKDKDVVDETLRSLPEGRQSGLTDPVDMAKASLDVIMAMHEAGTGAKGRKGKVPTLNDERGGKHRADDLLNLLEKLPPP